MTDNNLADATYLEPITSDAIENIIIQEKPDAILPTVGGQTALDITIEMDKAGIFKKYNIELIGANINSIEKAENREIFKHVMDEVGIDTAQGGFAKTKKEANTIINTSLKVALMISIFWFTPGLLHCTALVGTRFIIFFTL